MTLKNLCENHFISASGVWCLETGFILNDKADKKKIWIKKLFFHIKSIEKTKKKKKKLNNHRRN